MTVNIKLNREVVSALVGLVVLLFCFVSLMWFPAAFAAVVAIVFKTIVVLAAAGVIGALVTLGIYNLLGLASNDNDDDEDDE